MGLSTETLPHWDMSVVYPGLDSPEFEEGFREVVRSIDRLAALFDERGIGRDGPPARRDSPTEDVEAVIQSYNAVLAETRTLGAYIQSFITTDSRNQRAQAKYSELQQALVRLSVLGTRFTAWIGSLDVEALIRGSSIAGAHAFMLRKAKRGAEHLMPPAEEALAAELAVTGSSAWSKMYSTFTSQLLVRLEIDGKTEALPMSAVRNLAFNPDRDIRRRAYEAELQAWRDASVPIAAALNGIKGEVNALTQRRGWQTPLDKALFDNNVDRQTLDAMMEAMRASFPDFRRYLRAKARALGMPALAWYDIFAPAAGSTRVWPYDEATAFVREQFGTFSPRLRGLAERAFGEGWIDAEPRSGKVDGAFCMFLRNDESRVLMNYNPAFRQVSTLAHELGHAYHNLNLAERTMLQRATPMTLAETASIFCETIVRQAAFGKMDAPEQLAILEASLDSACQVVVDISSRFLFEQTLFDRRRGRELSADELCQIMLDTQLRTYGDGLDPDALHPYMWAAKPHYYGSSFYNFPYAFGLLFGMGLYARYEDDPEGFKARYDDLLSSTGLDEAADLAGSFGIDIRTPDFWGASLALVKADIDRFEALVDNQPSA